MSEREGRAGESRKQYLEAELTYLSYVVTYLWI